jgi:hapalindole-type alkaloid chlorinase
MNAHADDEPFPRVLDVDADAVRAQVDLFDRLRRLDLHAVRVRGAFSPSLAAAVVGRLESDAFAVKSADAPPEGEPVQLFGQPVQWAASDLREYLRTAERFRAASKSLWQGIDYEGRVCELLGALTCDRPVEVVRAEGGAAYTPSTIRSVAPGGSIPPHVENHQLDSPGCTDLRERIDRAALMSFFSLLSAPDSGGLLGMYSMTVDDFARSPDAGAGQVELRRELTRYRLGYIALEPGDMLVFNSGRFFHTVTPVSGARRRWTIGGFLALSRGGESVRYWG